MSVHEHMKILGMPVRDIVTGMKGVVSHISFDLQGCVQVYVTPQAKKDGGLPDGAWFDTKRMKVIGKEPIMPLPTFAIVPGGQKAP